ncbi:DUF1853 family protein [Massilia sp. S19_KUP03_FR1]|uniref:DUF1853 family protein n=1 Tax=Massilia sp. S19_KUP03_FR1 TaxID=3025503 RepID=UPI002FCDD014
MSAPPDPAAPDTYQGRFDRRWGALRHARVRALAWLLDAPDLLDAGDPCWHGEVMSLTPVTPETERWLFALDHDPAPLDAALGERAFTRLGLYAEKLMAFYFREQGVLVAHSLQIRAARNDTVGEFDFLLDAGGGLEHIEFATKFYLLQRPEPDDLDALVGPNLADSLGAKMRKIVEKQLVLGQHPAAQAQLPGPVVRARALVKGWLFYPLAAPAVSAPPMRAINRAHCHGFWCAIDEFALLPDALFLVLPKLQWLAPFRATSAPAMQTRAALHATLCAQFESADGPVLVAILRQQAGHVVEIDRGFIVPATWRANAAAKPLPNN